ncbi:hypothetical protein PWG14_27925, partial [Chromobacterium amazonense]|uniref:hypothetical protein n=1 Tax=Chromobacterium amazonense TaxID=1382803 RepID=UPI00237DBFFB
IVVGCHRTNPKINWVVKLHPYTTQIINELNTIKQGTHCYGVSSSFISSFFFSSFFFGSFFWMIGR